MRGTGMSEYTGLDLDALESVANAATPGPWEAGEEAPEWTASQRVFAPGLGDEQDDTICEAVEFKDATHIAAFDPPTVLALIARVRAAEKELRARELHHFEEEQARERAEATIGRVRSLIAREGGTNINIVNRILDELEGSPS